MPAMGALSTLVVVATVAVVATRDDTRQPAPRLAGDAPSEAPRSKSPSEAAIERGGPVVSQKTSDKATSAPQLALAPPLHPAPTRADGARVRRVERNASLTLAPPADRIEQVADAVIRVADRVGGFVVSSSVTGSDGPAGAAQLELRVPASELRRSLRELSELAHVRSRTQDSLDITGPTVTAADRLADARAERQALLRRLAAATTPNETDSIRAQLRFVRSRIARARGDLATLRNRANFATVNVDVEPGSGAKPRESGSWGLGEALDDALAVLAVTLGVVLVAFGVLLPLLVLGAFGWLTARTFLRRRRERTLDPS